MNPELNVSYWESKVITRPWMEYVGPVEITGGTAGWRIGQGEDLKIHGEVGAYTYATVTRDKDMDGNTLWAIWLIRCLTANLPLGPWELVGSAPLVYTGSQGTKNNGWVAAGNLMLTATGWRMYYYGNGSAIPGGCAMQVTLAPAETSIDDLPGAMTEYESNPILTGSTIYDAQIWTPDMSGLDHWTAIAAHTITGEVVKGRRAVSTDGITWAWEGAGYIIDLGAAGEWDAYSIIPVGKPVYRNGRWESPYQGACAATGRWGIGWGHVNAAITTYTKDPRYPVLSIGMGGTPTMSSIENPCPWYVGGKLHLFAVCQQTWQGALIGVNATYTLQCFREI